MKTLLLLLILPCFTYQQRNPGLILQINHSTLNEIKERLVPLLHKHMQNLTVTDELTSGILTIGKTRIFLGELQSKNITTRWESESSFILVLKNVLVQFKTDFYIGFSFWKYEGILNTLGGVSTVEFRMSFKEINEFSFKPYMNVEMLSVKTNMGNWRFHIEQDKFPVSVEKFVLPMLISYMQNNILEIGKKRANELNHVKLNRSLEENFPIELNIFEDVFLSTRLVRKPIIKESKLFLHFDASVYKGEGMYKRIKEPENLHLAFESGKFIQAFISENVINALLRGVGDKLIESESNVTKIKLLTTGTHKFISIKHGGAFLDNIPGEATVSYQGYSLDVRFTMTGDVSLVYMFNGKNKVKLTINTLTFNEFNILNEGYGISYLSRPVKNIVYAYLMAVNNEFMIDIPDFNVPFGLKLEHLDVYFWDGQAITTADFITDTILVYMENKFKECMDDLIEQAEIEE